MQRRQLRTQEYLGSFYDAKMRTLYSSATQEPPFYGQPPESTSSTVRKHLEDFCNNSSIPGLKYLTEPNRPWYERLLWVLGVSASVVACVFLVQETWQRWVASPVIVALDESLRAVWDVPFPAVTVCPLARVDHRRFNFSAAVQKIATDQLSPSEKKSLYYLGQQCDYPPLEEIDDDDGDAVEYIEKCAVSLEDTVTEVAFRNNHNHISTEFKPLMTESGLCYSVNMLPGHEIFRPETFHAEKQYIQYGTGSTEEKWSIDGGYTPQASAWDRPLRALGAGEDGGMFLVLKVNPQDMESFCTLSLQGFEVVVHSPAYFPMVKQQSFLVPVGWAVNVVMRPVEVMTSERLRGYSPGQRKCFFPDERYLRFFKQYSRHNCEVECLSNITRQHCGCVAFYMPRTLDTGVCGTNKFICIKDAIALFQQVESGVPVRGRRGPPMADFEGVALEPCDCKQSCSGLSYSATRSQVQTDVLGHLKQMLSLGLYNTTGLENFSNYNWTLMWIYFEESHFIPTRRMELFGITTFIANCGGVLGLCLGMSFLSAIELFYWCCVRSCRSKREVCAGRPPGQPLTRPPTVAVSPLGVVAHNYDSGSRNRDLVFY